MDQNYRHFFRKCTGKEPFPYQKRLAEGAWPDLIDVPTGLGKTAAIVLAWLWRQLHDDAPRRLVYCLPMRSLVTQTYEECEKWLKAVRQDFGGVPPSLHMLMGGSVDDSWTDEPERPAILIGTQDQLISRALNRGYTVSPFAWVNPFGLLNNDALWIFDETQVMGVTVETSAQLSALREKIGVIKETHTIWMSATLGQKQIETVDHPRPEAGWCSATLDGSDYANKVVAQRITAKKKFIKAELEIIKERGDAKDLADLVCKEHQEGTLTLVIVNRVDRAREVYQAIRKKKSESTKVGLVHSRFRSCDRKISEDLLKSQTGDRIIVATQAVEAGVDVDATTMFTELAPWPSLVQRFGRCNRYGERNDTARVFWVDIDVSKTKTALPYDESELEEARQRLEIEDVGPGSLSEIEYTPPSVVRNILRRRDLVALFDTSADLSGKHLDVGRFVRDDEDRDVHVYWRKLETAGDSNKRPRPTPQVKRPAHNELCRVAFWRFQKFVKNLSSDGEVWTWSSAEGAWDQITRPFQIRPGMKILMDPSTGGYHQALGWTGSGGDKPGATKNPGGRAHAGTGNNFSSENKKQWIELTAHLGHVSDEAGKVAQNLSLRDRWRLALIIAARWHDLGKVHQAFQAMLAGINEEHLEEKWRGKGLLWAKSNHSKGSCDRRYFRHELVSALAWIQARGAEHTIDDNLVAFLIATHHGKVRLHLRALPNEKPPADDPSRRFVRGVHDGDHLPAVTLPGGEVVEAQSIDLSIMEIGPDCWSERMIGLRDDPALGPFRLAYLEAMLRAADHRASRKEEYGGYDD